MKKTRILIVDDEPDFTWSLRLLLESSPEYVVREVNDSRKAIDAMREFDPHLILMDIMMPEMDGSELVAIMRAEKALKDIPVVYLTALVTKQEAFEPAFGVGQRRYLPNPVKWAELVECIERRQIRTLSLHRAAANKRCLESRNRAGH